MNRRSMLKLMGVAPLAPKALAAVPAPMFDDSAIRRSVQSYYYSSKLYSETVRIWSYAVMIPISEAASEFLDRGSVPLDLHFDWIKRTRAGGDEGTAYYKFLRDRWLRQKQCSAE